MFIKKNENSEMVKEVIFKPECNLKVRGRVEEGAREVGTG
jgi:hypothetical protein